MEGDSLGGWAGSGEDTDRKVSVKSTRRGERWVLGYGRLEPKGRSGLEIMLIKHHSFRNEVLIHRDALSLVRSSAVVKRAWMRSRAKNQELA